MTATQHLTPQPPNLTEAQARAFRQFHKARAARAQKPGLDPAYLRDERYYERTKEDA